MESDDEGDERRFQLDYTNGLSDFDSAQRDEEIQKRDELDEKFGFWRFAEGEERSGWMVNMQPVSWQHV